MRVSITERLLRQTGHDVAWWNERIATQGGLANEAPRCHPSMILTTSRRLPPPAYDAFI